MSRTLAPTPIRIRPRIRGWEWFLYGAITGATITLVGTALILDYIWSQIP